MNLSNEAILFIAFLTAVLGPPSLAGILYYGGMRIRTASAPLLVLSGVTIIAWALILLSIPEILRGLA